MIRLWICIGMLSLVTAGSQLGAQVQNLQVKADKKVPTEFFAELSLQSGINIIYSDNVIERLKEVEELDHFRNWQPPITGEMIMETFGIKPGRLVGEIKTAIREAILDGNLESDYEHAYAFMLKEGLRHGLIPI